MAPPQQGQSVDVGSMTFSMRGRCFGRAPRLTWRFLPRERFQRRVILLLVSFVLGISWFDPPKSKPQLLGIDLL